MVMIWTLKMILTQCILASQEVAVVEVVIREVLSITLRTLEGAQVQTCLLWLVSLLNVVILLIVLQNMISTACVCLQYGVFDSVNPSQFICHSNPTGTFPTEQPHLHALVTLTSKIAEGATGHVHGGILEVEDVKLPIVMKIGFGPEEVQQLQYEHHIYDLLYKAGVQVSTVYGLFKEDYEDSDATGLIMSYGGSNLEKLSKVTKKQRCVVFIILNLFR